MLHLQAMNVFPVRNWLLYALTWEALRTGIIGFKFATFIFHSLYLISNVAKALHYIEKYI